MSMYDVPSIARETTRRNAPPNFRSLLSCVTDIKIVKFSRLICPYLYIAQKLIFYSRVAYGDMVTNSSLHVISLTALRDKVASLFIIYRVWLYLQVWTWR